MSELENKIEANDRSIQAVLSNQKYTVDYFQREYSWEKKHMEQLVTDLASAFLAYYEKDHHRKEVANYNSYYLGPFVLSNQEGTRSIIDGQQRLTSLTLFLIFLDNYQRELKESGELEDLQPLSDMIHSTAYGEKSFNINVEERVPCLKSLFENGEYTATADDDASTVNMAERYTDIANAFPEEEIDAHAFPYFIDWFTKHVVLVEIIAYSDENAYTIFETMNDRGLSLTPTEMLKGYLLSRFRSANERKKADTLWKNSMKQLHEIGKEIDQHFFQSWFRGKYAITIRQAKVGSENEDFEKVGTRFHAWFRDRLELMGLQAQDQEGFKDFVNVKMDFYLKAYLSIRKAETTWNEKLSHVYYINRFGMADSLSYPLMLAPLKETDTEAEVLEKINLVALYIEVFVVKRSINYKKFGASSIRYTMSSLAKEIRDKSLSELKEILSKKLTEMEQTWDKLSEFGIHGQNGRFIKFLLSRISGYIDQESGQNTDFSSYYETNGKPFEIEHIWANHFDRHQDEFDQVHAFDATRNNIGGLILLPRGTNQSYGDKTYTEKQPHYEQQNLLVQSLCEKTYENNPNFLSMVQRLNLPFKAHPEFKTADIQARHKLYQAICEQIWDFPEPEQST